MKTLPFYLLLLTTFGLAGFDKLTVLQVPGWFQSQFKNTAINLFPGSLTAAYFGIALLEITTFGLIALGLLRREPFRTESPRYLSYGLFSAQLSFVVLAFGQRLSHQYDSAASLFFYAALTFIGGHFARAES